MAKGPSLLSSPKPTTICPSQTHIGHVQLRDLIICPRQQGVVNYVNQQSIVEHDLHAPNSTPHTLVDLHYTPNTLSSLQVYDSEHTLLAAGGQEAEIHLSLHDSKRNIKPLWRLDDQLHASINNSVLLTSMNLARSNESSVEPKIVVSNNDCSVKFYDVPLRVRNSPKLDKEVGSMRLNVPVNHSSISPDGLTLLSVGDSSNIFLHRISGGSRLSFTPITNLTMPPPDRSPLSFPSTSLAASFSTAFSHDGMKYAVASQEGVVAIWDVRSTKTLKVFQTDKGRLPSEGGHWTGGWLSDDPYEWTRGNSKAPGWSVRNVKFGSGGNGIGREIMTFTEHTSFLHVVDARTFETEEIIHIPPVSSRASTNPQRQVPSRTPSQQNLHASSQSRSRSRAFVSRPYQRPLRSNNPRHVAVSATSHLGGGTTRHESTMPPYVVLALEDTFRISPRGSSSDVSSSGNRALWRSRTTERLTDGDLGYGDRYIPSSALRDDEEDLVVIPPFGDREVEENVRVLFNHGLGTRSRGFGSFGNVTVGVRGSSIDHDDGDSRDPENVADDRDRMDVDDRDFEMETEWDCVSSHVPSRSSTPPPPISVSASGRSNGNTNVNRWRSWSRVPQEIQDTIEDLEGDSVEQTRTSADHNKYYDMDIAGTCFDPSGSRIYVATTESVSEWSVRGGEKRWWADSGTEAWC
ncbi:hypothetical protein E1B28_010978 [Marasmius oreades]|uniref:DUF2415 domain-containing protein n=1 Tax=Marasmius oreades TaxID=181124 RepID=A0A9P7RT65_9AGAR|nr:uncharacterized protein E1B28_010978 [Marasmius oreades]KAG7089279.1 hypothetical protein E1B28_010978 [Marasmius oreades]